MRVTTTVAADGITIGVEARTDRLLPDIGEVLATVVADTLTIALVGADCWAEDDGAVQAAAAEIAGLP